VIGCPGQASDPPAGRQPRLFPALRVRHAPWAWAPLAGKGRVLPAGGRDACPGQPHHPATPSSWKVGAGWVFVRHHRQRTRSTFSWMQYHDHIQRFEEIHHPTEPVCASCRPKLAISICASAKVQQLIIGFQDGENLYGSSPSPRSSSTQVEFHALSSIGAGHLLRGHISQGDCARDASKGLLRMDSSWRPDRSARLITSW